MEPLKYPEPRNIRQILQSKMCGKYKNAKISEIPLSTEFILKSIKPKDTAKAEIILLKYQVINVDWDQMKLIADMTFHSNMFKFIKNEEQIYEDTGGAY
jgi:hypothetical protein